MNKINSARSGNDREYQIIELVQHIVNNSSLSSYADLWAKAGFTITRNYAEWDHTTTPLRFSSTPLYRQIASFDIVETKSEEAVAERIIDLVVPLLRERRYYDYFDLWGRAGFYINPYPAIEVETSGFKPNLFLLGAAKSGTSTLYSYLREIPSICVSNPKEPFFFEAEYELGLDFYRRRYFAHWNGESIVGEARHRNLYLPFIAERIFTVNPQAKLVACLRNPIERAYSHWWHWYSRQTESLEFDQAMEEDIKRVQAGWLTATPEEIEIYKQTLDLTGKGIYRTYVDSGYYYEQLCRYLEYFPKTQIKIILFEDLEQDLYSVIKDLETFIGTDYYGPDNFVLKMENIHLPGNKDYKRTPISAKFRSYLQDHYQVHNENLAKYLGRDLSHWR